MKLSDNFELDQFTLSQTAVRNDIENFPTPEALFALQALCTKVLEPLVAKGFKFGINSGYRCPALNKLIGGAENSQHCKGQAVDLNPIGMSVEEFYQGIAKSGIPFDQLIQEFGKWVHISYVAEPRKQKLRAVKKNGKTVYEADGIKY
jgi:zinc D-Ala-D-Ala carboxypeptidase